MQQTDKPTLHYRLGDEQYRIIEDDVVYSLEQYKSEKDFTKKAIQNNARALRGLAAGGKTAKRLVLLLSNIRGIDEELPDRSVKARIKDEGLTDNMTISLEKQAYGWLREITKETLLDKSKATRYCTVSELANVAQGTDVLPGWAHDSIIQTSVGLKTSLARPKLNLYYIFAERFMLNLEETEYFIERDSRPFGHFAEAYKDDFHETRPYNELRDQLGDRVFTNVENTIEEYAGISMDTDTKASGFLEKYLEE